MKIPFLSFFSTVKDFFTSGNILVFWYRYYKILVFTGFLLVLFFGGWSYYYSVYWYRFSDEEKKQYVDSYFKETNFKEARFHEVVDSLTARAAIHERKSELKRNIFIGKEAKP
jgi:hypothetical protein